MNQGEPIKSTEPPDLKQWYVLELVLAPEAEELVTYALWSWDTTGIETVRETTTEIVLAAYFAARPPLADLRAALLETLKAAAVPPTSLRHLAVRTIPNEDWLRKWKEGYEPFPVGQRFYITPSWKTPNPQETAGRLVLKLDPGMAFGTGTHETTKLCLEALETYWNQQDLLDVGTGTGILAIAAARLSPEAYICACDIDSNAVSVARENAEINQVQDIIEFRAGSASDYPPQRFSFVLANLTIDIIKPMLPKLTALLVPGGVLVVSGILAEQLPSLVDEVRQIGLGELARHQMGEWALLACTKR